MKTADIISPQRLLHLLKRDLLSNRNTTVIIFGAITAIIYLISAVTAYSYSPSDKLYTSLFTKFLFAGGLIASSMIFKEMHMKETAQNYLLLPASNFEKFFARLLISTVGFAALSIFGLSLISYLCEGINTLILNRHNQIFNPFTKDIWMITAHYFVVQSLFFLGAVYFRNYNFIKTINVIFLSTVFILIIGVFFTKIVYFDISNGFPGINDITLLVQGNRITLNLKNIDTITSIIKPLYWIIPAPLFWTIAYFRIKEEEVKNAI